MKFKWHVQKIERVHCWTNPHYKVPSRPFLETFQARGECCGGTGPRVWIGLTNDRCHSDTLFTGLGWAAKNWQTYRRGDPAIDNIVSRAMNKPFRIIINRDNWHQADTIENQAPSVFANRYVWIMFGVNPILIVVLGMKYVQDLDILSNVCISDGVDICVMDIRTLIAVQQVSGSIIKNPESQWCFWQFMCIRWKCIFKKCLWPFVVKYREVEIPGDQ